MDGIIAYILSKKYTNDTVIGMGAIKGAACQVQSINKVNKTTTITLEWEDNLGTSHTQSFDVEDGLDGVSVTGATIKPDGHLELTLSNGTTIDCGKVLPQYDTMPTPSSSNEGQILQYIGTTTSSYTNGYFYQCINDGGVYKWVEKSVQDSYTKGQIGSLSDLPDTSKNVIENIADIKLSVDQLSASKLSISDIDNELSDISENPVQNKVIKLTLDQLRGSILDKLDEKEDKFRYSIMPTASVDYLNKIVEYIGTTDSTYTNGYFYQCRFDGTNYSWVQKNVQPSSGGTGGDGVVDGYYNSTDHLFYEESTFINPITGDNNTLYVSLDTNLLYRYNGLIFIRVDESSSGEDDVINGYYNTIDGKFYEDSTYTTEIVGQTGKIYISIDTNIQYRWDNLSLPNKFVTISSSIAVDSALSDTSENPVQNKVITVPLEALQGSVLTKMQKMLSAQQDNFAIFDNGGQVVDSNISKDIIPSDASSSNKLATKNDIETYTGSNGVDIDGNNNITLDISYLTASRVGYIPSSEKGAHSGVAELDSTGKVPSSQLPSYIDDVIDGYYNTIDGKFYEDSSYTTEIVGESGKIYISVDTDIQYRWTGTAFAALGGALQLGETASTAYRGDRGKIAYDHSQITDGSNPHNTTADNVNLKVPISALSGSKLDVESTLYGLYNKSYLTDDTTETTIDDADYVPFYDTSASAKKKISWSNIKSVLKTYFDNIYATIANLNKKADLTDLAPAFDDTATYAIGDYVTYTDGDVYRFTSAHTGAWASGDVTKIDIGAELKNKISKSSTAGLVKNDGTIDTNTYVSASALNGKADLSDLAADFDATVNYVQNDYVNYNGDIYKFTANHNAGVWIGSDATKIIVTTEFKNPVQWTTL